MFGFQIGIISSLSSSAIKIKPLMMLSSITNRMIGRLSRVRVPTSASSNFAPLQLQNRFFADAVHHYEDHDHDEWVHEFKMATVGVAEMDPKTVDPATSAQRLRDLVKSGLLRHTDLRDHPERFFEGRNENYCKNIVTIDTLIHQHLTTDCL